VLVLLDMHVRFCHSEYDPTYMVFEIFKTLFSYLPAATSSRVQDTSSDNQDTAMLRTHTVVHSNIALQQEGEMDKMGQLQVGVAE
jgi:hypothetical protein